MPLLDFHGQPATRHRHQEIDPTDPKHWSFIPNHWKNRAAVQQYGESPNRSLVLPPEPEPDRPWWYDYASHLRRNQKIDPLKAARIRVDSEAKENFHPRRYCGTCIWDDKQRTEETSHRPPGASRDACHGCIFSNYDVEIEDLRDKRDKAYFQWASAKNRIMDLESEKKNAQDPADKKRWVKSKKAAVKSLREAAEACKRVGINPGRRLRRETLHGKETENGKVLADQPTRPLEDKVVTYVFKRK